METLYDKASLILNPGIYDTGKVYCTKPLDGSGDLTFTRASSATRVGPDGLIEKVRTNLILQSNSFDTTWILSNATATSGQSGYDGSSDATLVAATGTFSRTYQNVSGSGVYTGSLYVKAGTASWVLLRIQGTNNNQLYVNLSDGTYNVSGGDVISQKVNSIGSGWYRLELSINTSLVTFNVYPALGNADLGTSNETIYIQNAQLETGDIATDYIATTTAAVSVGPVSGLPRLDYFGSSCPRLLLEPQRTNIALFSESFDNAIWTKGGSNSVTANAIISPDGTQNADFIVSTATNTVAKYVYQVIGSTATPTATIYAKAGAITEMMFYCQGGNGIYFNLTNGAFIDYYASGSSTITSYSSVAVGNGWYRYAMTFNTSVTSIEAYMSVNTNISSSIADGDGFYLWGFQLEAASYATSYIPTLGAAVTRTKDACSKTGISSLIGQTEGTLFAEFEIPVNTQDGDIIAIRNGTSSANGIFVSYRSSSVVQLIVRTGSTNALIFQRTGSYAIGTNKIAAAYKNGDFAISLNGTAAQVNTSSITMPTSLNSVVLFVDNMYAQTLPVPYAQALVFKTRLTNAQLAELTAL